MNEYIHVEGENLFKKRLEDLDENPNITDPNEEIEVPNFEVQNEVKIEEVSNEEPNVEIEESIEVPIEESIEEKIELTPVQKLEEKIKKLKAQKQELQSKESKKERAARTRRLIIIGATFEEAYGIKTVEEAQQVARFSKNHVKNNKEKWSKYKIDNDDKK